MESMKAYFCHETKAIVQQLMETKKNEGKDDNMTEFICFY